MLSAISRCVRTRVWPLANASSTRVKTFTAKVPCLDEQPTQQPTTQPPEGTGRPIVRFQTQNPTPPSAEQSHEFTGSPRIVRTMLPSDSSRNSSRNSFRGSSRVVKPNVIACIEDKEMEQILSGSTTWLYRKYYLNPVVKYVWLYVKRPVGKLAYVVEVGEAKQVPGELELLPYYEEKRMARLREAMDAGSIRALGNGAGGEQAAAEGSSMVNTGTEEGALKLPNFTFASQGMDKFLVPGIPRYAFHIVHLWELVHPSHGICCEELWERGYLDSPPPPKYINAKEGMLSRLPLDKQKLLF